MDRQHRTASPIKAPRKVLRWVFNPARRFTIPILIPSITTTPITSTCNQAAPADLAVLQGTTVLIRVVQVVLQEALHSLLMVTSLLAKVVLLRHLLLRVLAVSTPTD